ncbi:hypothetical protein FB107DRAFT_249126 [Schizophyllum commune]
MLSTLHLAAVLCPIAVLFLPILAITRPSTYVLLWYPYIYFACNIFDFLRIHVNLLASTAIRERGILYRAVYPTRHSSATCEYYAPDAVDDARYPACDARYPAYDARYPAYDVANSDDVAYDARDPTDAADDARTT